MLKCDAAETLQCRHLSCRGPSYVYFCTFIIVVSKPFDKFGIAAAPDEMCNQVLRSSILTGAREPLPGNTGGAAHRELLKTWATVGGCSGSDCYPAKKGIDGFGFELTLPFTVSQNRERTCSTTNGRKRERKMLSSRRGQFKTKTISLFLYRDNDPNWNDLLPGTRIPFSD